MSVSKKKHRFIKLEYLNQALVGSNEDMKLEDIFKLLAIFVFIEHLVLR